MRVHNKHKTHCPHGHEYSAENTRLVGGKRHCITCHRQRNLEGYYRRQAEENSVPSPSWLDSSNFPSADTSAPSDSSYSSSDTSYSTDTTGSSDTSNGGDFGGGGASGDY